MLKVDKKRGKSVFVHILFSDIVTQIPLPAQGFKHIGKFEFFLFLWKIFNWMKGTMVLLDRNGNLMVDPSVIEKSWSHRQGTNSFFRDF